MRRTLRSVVLLIALVIAQISGSAPDAFAQSRETPAERCSWEGWLPPAAGRERVRRRARLDSATIARLVLQVRSTDKNARLLAADRLGAAQNAQALAALLDLTSDPDPVLQEMAARSLGRMGATSAISVITPLASSQNSHLRQGAVWALGQLQDPTSAGALITASRDTSKHVRNEATWALGLVGGSDATQRLKELAADDNAQVRLAAVCSLRTIVNDSQVSAILATRAYDRDPIVREAAVWAATQR